MKVKAEKIKGGQTDVESQDSNIYAKTFFFNSNAPYYRKSFMQKKKEVKKAEEKAVNVRVQDVEIKSLKPFFGNHRAR